MAPSMLRAADVAKRLACHVTTVHRLARSGQLPAVRIGGMVRFKAADVERLEAEGTCRERTEDGICGARRMDCLADPSNAPRSPDLDTRSRRCGRWWRSRGAERHAHVVAF